jgi:pimeloyl-ACP methyl ester carboxylesterase
MPYAQVFSVPHAFTLTSKPTHSNTTVVFIHGWLLSQCYWQPVVEFLKDDFQCLSYDMRGFGQSTQNLNRRSPPSPHNYPPFSLAAYAQDLGELLRMLNLEQVWLVGHSLGGSVALWAAKLFPHQVRGVICVNAGGGIYLPQEFGRFRQAGQQIVRWRSQWLQFVPFIDCVFSQLMVNTPLALTWGRCRISDLLAADPTAATGVLLESTTEKEVHQLPQVVAGLTQPTYFIAGEEDIVMEEKFVRHLASFHKLFDTADGNVSILPDCGHMAMVEKPTEVAQSIHHWILASLRGVTWNSWESHCELGV